MRLFLSILIYFTALASHAERYNTALDLIRTSDDALSEGKRNCVHFKVRSQPSVDDDDIELENDNCYYTKHDFKILSHTFIRALKQTLDLEILTTTTSVRQLIEHQNLDFTNLERTLIATATSVKLEQRCAATFSSEASQAALISMRSAIEQYKYPRVKTLASHLAHSFTCF